MSARMHQIHPGKACWAMVELNATCILEVAAVGALRCQDRICACDNCFNKALSYIPCQHCSLAYFIMIFTDSFALNEEA